MKKMYSDELIQTRASEDGKKRYIEGYAVKYNAPGKSKVWTFDRGGIREEVLRGAFKRSLETNKVKFFYQHNRASLLARTESGTGILEDREDGLFYSIEIPNTQLGNDVYEQVMRKDLRGASIGFRKPLYKFRGKGNDIVGSIIDLDLTEISIVDDPYYESSTVDARSIIDEYKDFEHQETYSDIDLDLCQKIVEDNRKD